MRIVLDDPEIRAKLALNGGFVRHMTPEEVTAFVQNEQKTWRPILEQVAQGERRSRRDYLNSRAFASSAACSIVMNTAPSAASLSHRSSSASMR